MIRLDDVLVLQTSEPSCLSFAFRGRYWSVYTLLISIALLIAASRIRGIETVPFREYLVPGGYLFAGLFACSSLFSYFRSARLLIDGNAKIVSYRSSGLFGKRQWSKAFSEFSEVRIWRPGRRSFLKVLLRLADNQEISLGTSEAGIFGLEKARALAAGIAAIMHIPVLEEATVSS